MYVCMFILTSSLALWKGEIKSLIRSPLNSLIFTAKQETPNKFSHVKRPLEYFSKTSLSFLHYIIISMKLNFCKIFLKIDKCFYIRLNFYINSYPSTLRKK